MSVIACPPILSWALIFFYIQWTSVCSDGCVCEEFVVHARLAVCRPDGTGFAPQSSLHINEWCASHGHPELSEPLRPLAPLLSSLSQSHAATLGDAVPCVSGLAPVLTTLRCEVERFVEQYAKAIAERNSATMEAARVAAVDALDDVTRQLRAAVNGLRERLTSRRAGIASTASAYSAALPPASAALLAAAAADEAAAASSVATSSAQVCVPLTHDSFSLRSRAVTACLCTEMRLSCGFCCNFALHLDDSL